MKYMISQEELDAKMTAAIDATLLPLLEELQTLGVSPQTLNLAMKNIVAKEMASDKPE